MDTKGIIVDAACKVFKRYPLEQVTVQKIISEASVSRSSFYKYFEDKFDVLEYFCVRSIDEVYRELAEETGRVSCDRLNRKLNQVFYENADMFRILFLRDPDHTLDRCLEERIYLVVLTLLVEATMTPVNETLKAYALCCSGGLCRLLREWTTGSLKLDIDEFTAVTSDILNRFITKIDP